MLGVMVLVECRTSEIFAIFKPARCHIIVNLCELLRRSLLANKKRGSLASHKRGR